jgi:hypothetical protein
LKILYHGWFIIGRNLGMTVIPRKDFKYYSLMYKPFMSPEEKQFSQVFLLFTLRIPAPLKNTIPEGI